MIEHKPTYMPTAIENEKSYLDAICSLPDLLKQSYNSFCDGHEFDLTSTEITLALLERMKAYYYCQEQIKLFLNKDRKEAGADFFVESVLFFVKAYLQSNRSELTVCSEKTIIRKRNAIRPDITIMRNDEIVAIIECKTNLGFIRNGWEQQYLGREVLLKNEFPNAKAFLLVMEEWNSGDYAIHKSIGTQYFCLLKKPGHMASFAEKDICTPVEGLFKQIGDL